MSNEPPNQPSRTADESCVDDWPTYTLEYTFNPDRKRALDPDEVFVFDPDRIATNDEHWITAKRGAYLPIEDCR